MKTAINSPKFSARVGALSPSLGEQLAAQKLHCDPEKLQHFEMDIDALNRLRIRGLLTDAQARSATTKLFKRLQREVSSQPLTVACPWCGSDESPLPNEQDGSERNPLLCRLCGGIGDEFDWGLRDPVDLL